MAKKGNRGSCLTAVSNMGCCRVESLISVDERGQMVLPKELRERAKIQPGDKLAVASWEKDGKIFCLTLIRTDYFSDMVKDFLGPMMGEVLKK